MTKIVKSKKWIKDNPGLVKAWRAKGITVSRTGKPSKSKTKGNPTNNPGGRRTARRKFKLHMSGLMVAGGMANTLYLAVKNTREAGDGKYAERLIHLLTGYNVSTKQFEVETFVKGGGLIALGAGVHYAAKEMDLNRMLGQMKVPLLRA